MSKNPENRWKLMKIANIDREILHNFWKTWGVSMKFSGKMWLMIKVTKNQSLTLFLEIHFPKNHREGVKLPPSSFPLPPIRFRVKVPKKLFFTITIKLLTKLDRQKIKKIPHIVLKTITVKFLQDRIKPCRVGAL